MAKLPDDVILFLRTIETCTHGFEFMPEERLNELPPDVANHIIELEDLICRLKCEATAVLFDNGYFPFIAKRRVD